MFVIDDEKDVEYLRWLCKRLYSEDRMNGDAMRDAEQRLQILFRTSSDDR